MGRLAGASRSGNSEALLKQAQKVGLGSRAKQLTKSGEDPEQIFSGGIITDVFDALNALQYGTVGLMTGKTFAQGIKERRSFTDDDLLGDKGVPGLVAGIALDIAFDPFTYLAPATVLRKIPGLATTANKVGKALMKSDAVKKTSNYLGSKFIYRFGEPTIYKALDERRIKNIASTVQNIVELSRPLRKLDMSTRSALVRETTQFVKTAKKGETVGRMVVERVPIEELAKGGKLTKEMVGNIREMYKVVDDTTKAMVKEGILPKDVYKNLNKYINNQYRAYEKASRGIATNFADAKKMGLDAGILKARKDLPGDVREMLEPILDGAYLLPDTAIKMVRTLENARFFKSVGGKFAKDVAEDGLVKLPDTMRLGSLAGKYVPEPIFRSMQEIVDVKTGAQKTLGKVVAGFKFGKVILNPATHARNSVSNMILNHFEGLPLWRQDVYVNAAKELKTKGALWQEARKMGLGLDTYAANEIKALLNIDELSGVLGRGKKLTSRVVESLSNIYQKEEEFAKMAMYIYQRTSKKVSPEDAWKIAERATFNYAQITPFIRKLRESIFGFPFITFTYKATPQIARTIAKDPTKISNIGKIKNAIEQYAGLDELKAERATEPQWIKDGFYVKLPMKDKNGRSAYFDLTYILPFGDLVSGQFVERQRMRETGTPESIPVALLSKAPFFNLLKEIGRNEDFFGNKIWKDSDESEKQLGDLFRHIIKTYAPPTVGDVIPGGYRSSGEQRPSRISELISGETGVEGGGLQSRTLIQELFRNVGVKITPIDLELQRQITESFNQKALESLLGEAGEVKEFKKVYVPRRTRGKGRLNL